MRHDLLADALNIINNAERKGKRSCVVPASKLIKNILMAIHKGNYIGDFEFIDDGKSGTFRVALLGKINKSQTIKPRFAVGVDEYEKWESRYLPARNIGILVVSTSRGIMSQKEAIENKTGGRLLAYVY